MKVGDLVRYRQRKRSNVYGFVTGKVDDYKVRVSVFNNKDPWFHSTIAWDESHWEVINESG